MIVAVSFDKNYASYYCLMMLKTCRVYKNLNPLIDKLCRLFTERSAKK